MRTGYKRVIPRDLFNEANLLKCWGQLALLLHDRPRPGVEIQEPSPGHPFKIDQNPYDGSISITNMGIAIGGALYSARRPLNSREKWPLQLLTRDDDLIDIFNDDGHLSADFLAMLPEGKPAPICPECESTGICEDHPFRDDPALGRESTIRPGYFEGDMP